MTKYDQERLESAIRCGNVESCEEYLKKRFRNYKTGTAKTRQDRFKQFLVWRSLIGDGWGLWVERGYPSTVQGYVETGLPKEDMKRLRILKLLEADGRFPINYVEVATSSMLHGLKEVFLYSLSKFSRDNRSKFVSRPPSKEFKYSLNQDFVYKTIDAYNRKEIWYSMFSKLVDMNLVPGGIFGPACIRNRIMEFL